MRGCAQLGPKLDVFSDSPYFVHSQTRIENGSLFPSMQKMVSNFPASGYALVVDGRIKTEFSTKEGAEQGAFDLKRRFPSLQIGVYDAHAKRTEVIKL